MMYELPINDDAPKTVNELLRGWLENGKISAVIAMQETPSGKSAFPAMISDPVVMNTNVFAPLLPVSTGTMVSRLTKRRGFTEPVAVVLRSCELRALIELVKLHQADLTNVILVGVDCPGTFPMNTYSSYPGAGNPTEAVLTDGQAAKYMRNACLNCNPIKPNPELYLCRNQLLP